MRAFKVQWLLETITSRTLRAWTKMSPLWQSPEKQRAERRNNEASSSAQFIKRALGIEKKHVFEEKKPRDEDSLTKWKVGHCGA
jgi:hypothetical protein